MVGAIRLGALHRACIRQMGEYREPPRIAGTRVAGEPLAHLEYGPQPDRVRAGVAPAQHLSSFPSPTLPSTDRSALTAVVVPDDGGMRRWSGVPRRWSDRRTKVPTPTSPTRLRVLRAMVLLQVFLLVASLFAPIPVVGRGAERRSGCRRPRRRPSPRRSRHRRQLPSPRRTRPRRRPPSPPRIPPPSRRRADARSPRPSRRLSRRSSPPSSRRPSRAAEPSPRRAGTGRDDPVHRRLRRPAPRPPRARPPSPPPASRSSTPSRPWACTSSPSPTARPPSPTCAPTRASCASTLDRVRDAEAAPQRPAFADQWALEQHRLDRRLRHRRRPPAPRWSPCSTPASTPTTPDLAGQLVAGTSHAGRRRPATDRPQRPRHRDGGHHRRRDRQRHGHRRRRLRGRQGHAGHRPRRRRPRPGQRHHRRRRLGGPARRRRHQHELLATRATRPSLQAAIDYAWANDVVVVAATGNDGSSTVTFPAGDRGVIGVSATDQSDTLAPSSNYGPSMFLAAPGVDIVDHGPGRRLHLGHRHLRVVGDRRGRGGPAARERSAAPRTASSSAASPATPTPAGTTAETGNGRLNLARALADTSTDSVQPAGAAPVGDGGPFVGPYVAADTNVSAATVDTRISSCASVTTSFVYGNTVCARVIITGTGGGGGAGDFFVQWRPPTGAVTNVTRTVPSSTPTTFDETFIPTTTGNWTVAVCRNTGCSGGNQVAFANFTVTAKALTVAGITANNKVYDGTTTATLNTAGASLVGVVIRRRRHPEHCGRDRRRSTTRTSARASPSRSPAWRSAARTPSTTR